MIFVTVGTQLTFDRLMTAVDEWAEQTGVEVFAQTGATEKRFAHLRCTEFLQPADFDKNFTEAKLIIAHAGTGSILSALSYRKPVIIMPRQAALGEHRNDHQMATAQKFAQNPAIHVAWNETELKQLLATYDELINQNSEAISPYAPAQFLEKLKDIFES